MRLSYLQYAMMVSLLIFATWLSYMESGKRFEDIDKFRSSLTITHTGHALSTTISLSFMIVALHNFSVMVKKAGREYSKGYKFYMAFHVIFITLNILCGILVAVAAYPF